MNTLQLDQIDRQILRKLQANAKITNAQLAKDISLSPASTLERVRKLEHRGIVQSYHAKLAHAALGLHTQVLVQVRLHDVAPDTVAAFQAAIAQLPEVTECHQGLGQADFWLKIVTTTLAAYQRLVAEHLYPLGIVKDLQPFITTATLKDGGIPV